MIERSCRILAVEIPTIELAGGSVRCMIAGIHLDRRPVAPATVAAHTFA
ncbi:arginine deiminase-related protein [Salinibacterium sp.]|nr:arginine deiminase-related protein [Salinibacterium sp.]